MRLKFYKIKKFIVDNQTQETRHSSLETFADSIESDSLNRAYKKDDETDKKKTNCKDKKRRWRRRRKSENRNDFFKLLLIHIFKFLFFFQIPDDQLREQQLGSMDSDKFNRIQKERARIKENKEAIDKFFGLNRIDPPPLDSASSMEKVVREIIEQMHIRNSSWIRVNSGNAYQVTFTL